MAEPRRPRVIRSRPGAAPVPPAPPAQAEPEPSSQQTPTPEAINPGKAGGVRTTSGKVTLTPLPQGTATPSADTTAAAKRVSAKVTVSTIDAPSSDEVQATSEPVTGGGLAPNKSKAAKPKGKKSFRVPFTKGATGTDTKTALEDTAPAAKKPDSEAGARILAFPVPLHKRRRKRVLLAMAGTAVVLAVIMATALFSPALAVKTVTFDGLKLVPDATMQAAVAPLINKPLPQVTQKEVSALLAGVPQIKSSSIEARPPSTLLIHVVERIPVALLKNGDEYILVDQDGVKLGATADPTSVAVPLIDGGTAVIGKDTFVAMTAVLATLPQSVLGKLASASATSPDAVELQLSDGRLVVWGNASDMELKAQVLDALLTAPAPTAEPGKLEPAPVRVYDVSAPRHPVTR
ncbi:cell division protein FtsQ/DivIB [Arthrobacter sp. GMC3]|uniref:cell division protein FtsQ/DivIB n=1 Tax=Arthrobacter sp. GMC3 TaxID=2058894 RepID=UPI000CE51AEC|nr:cell division protein FtsQ/DivIB [Arthrobacter sp. GMC3]